MTWLVDKFSLPRSQFIGDFVHNSNKFSLLIFPCFGWLDFGKQQHIICKNEVGDARATSRNLKGYPTSSSNLFLGHFPRSLHTKHKKIWGERVTLSKTS
ncbi:hypothetical protein MTR_1g033970 [Medicago truncatula]|uniref:Uncharacterized protein n=1 Tax=Medicago truncatula TaxID=3880 RepID=A0A072VG09_MEDTR|nr:hypothetical protein MTR_1g033970 [Medicago truncatula]